jgi:hypothetical protein
MSLQRIFESARKLGVPVVITDPGGRDPLVVLPLEQFEALNESGQADLSAGLKASPAKEKSRVESLLADRALEMAQHRAEGAVVGAKPSPETGERNPDISLEERFYLEPVDDAAGV